LLLNGFGNPVFPKSTLANPGLSPWEGVTNSPPFRDGVLVCEPKSELVIAGLDPFTNQGFAFLV